MCLHLGTQVCLYCPLTLAISQRVDGGQKNAKSDYEVTRDKNIQANEAILASLELKDAAAPRVAKVYPIPEVHAHKFELLEIWTGQWTLTPHMDSTSSYLVASR